MNIERTNNFWIDNGIVILGKIVYNLDINTQINPTSISIEISEDEFQKLINSKIREKYFDEISNKKDGKINPKLFVNIFIKQYLGKTKNIWREEIFPKNYNNKCIFCNHNSSNEKHFKLAQAIFPFANAEFPAFISNKEEFSYVCPYCYVFGRLAILNTFFSIQGENYFYFVPYSYDLTILSEIYPLFEKSDSRSNYINRLAVSKEGKNFHTDKFYEELLSLLYYCYLELKKRDKDVIFKGLNSFYCFFYSKKQGSQKATPTNFFRFENTENIYKLFEKEKEILKNIFGYFYEKNKEYLRDEFCEHLIKGEDVIQDINEIIFIKIRYENNFSFPNLKEFLNLYYQEVIKMDKETKELCEKIGERIGNYAGGSIGEEKDRKDIVYKMRNADRVEKLVELMNTIMSDEVSFQEKGEDTLKSYLYKLNKENFWEIKEFTTAYALNQYLKVKYAKSKSEVKQ